MYGGKYLYVVLLYGEHPCMEPHCMDSRSCVKLECKGGPFMKPHCVRLGSLYEVPCMVHYSVKGGHCIKPLYGWVSMEPPPSRPCEQN